MGSHPDGLKPAEILENLVDCLRRLDAIDARLPAIHLATAIEQFRAQFDLPEISSSSD